jgi:hypothetical protein
MRVDDGGNSFAGSHTNGLDSAYTSDTGLDGKSFFTSSTFFAAKEIEVFEITD